MKLRNTGVERILVYFFTLNFYFSRLDAKKPSRCSQFHFLRYLIRVEFSSINSFPNWFASRGRIPTEQSQHMYAVFLTVRGFSFQPQLYRILINVLFVLIRTYVRAHAYDDDEYGGGTVLNNSIVLWCFCCTKRRDNFRLVTPRVSCAGTASVWKTKTHRLVET